jgi:hypothetical protein
MDDNQKIYDEMVEKSPSGHQYIYGKETLRMLYETAPKNVKILDIQDFGMLLKIQKVR